MNDTSQHDFDDELLSAYLDDELSTEERAAVEARLEVDPAAQQLLEQLRAASQAVQRLPQEPLGRDLTDAVLQRVVAKKLPLSPAEGSEGEPPMPGLSIGRTKRGWVWAALAIAAALLLMFVQSNDGRNNKLPAVAKRDIDGAKMAANDELSRRQLDDGPTLSPAPESAGRESAAPQDLASETAAPPATAVPAQQYFDKVSADGATAAKPASEPMPEAIDGQALGTSLAQNKLLKERSVEFSGGAPAGALADGQTQPLAESIDELKQETSRAAAPLGGASAELPSASRSSSLARASEESSADDDSLIVVNVVAKPEAMRKKTFDKILNDSGVFFDSDEASASNEPGFAATSRFAKSPQPARVAETPETAAGEAPVSAGDAVDAVLVEASPKIIVSCVEQLNKDHYNYVGLDIDESQSTDMSDKSVTLESDAAKIAPVKKLVTDLGRFRRGLVTPQQKQSASFDQRRLDDIRDRQLAENRFDQGAGVGGALGGSEIQSELKDGESMDRKESIVQNGGRAQRLFLNQSEKSQMNERSNERRRSGGGENEVSLEREGPQRKLKKLAQSGADNVKVLFYFWPDISAEPAAPSLPSENPPK